MRNKIKRIGALSLFAVTMVACGPVNYFTKVKKTPSEYSRNYCCGEVAVPKSFDESSPWIVYSDRKENATYYQPGGKVVLKQADFLEAFAVIGEKGNFLKLVKYKAEDFENGKIKDKSKVEYYGWMHKDNLLLSSRAVTDVATGFAIKMMAMVKDTLALAQPERNFADGDVVLFQEPELLTPKATIPLQQPMFLLKKSSDNSRCFVVGKEQFSAESAASLVAGWVSSSLVMPWGEYLYWNGASYDKDQLPFSSEEFQKTRSFESLQPILSMQNLLEGKMEVHTMRTVPLLDESKNFVYSLSGKKLSRSSLDKLVEDKKNINVLVVFSAERSISEKMAQITSSLQKLKEVFGKYSSDATIRLGFWSDYYSGRNLGRCELNEDIDYVLNLMSEQFSGAKQNYRNTSEAFGPLKESFDFFKGHKDECNLVVQIGTSSSSSSKIESIVDRLVENNCRVVGFQHISNQELLCSNFVLQLETMISRSSDRLSRKKLDVLVHSDQLVSTNQFREISDNAYALDFPRNSMWQGWIRFPKKKESLPFDMVVSTVDSILNEMVVDNANIILNLQKAFKTSGSGLTGISGDWKSASGVSMTYGDADFKIQSLAQKSPYTLFPYKENVTKQHLQESDYYLFLTESELDRVRTFLTEMTKVRLDFKGSSSRNKKKTKSKTCMDLFLNDNVVESDSLSREYLNALKVRKSMQKSILRWAKDEKMYPKKKKELKNMSLSQNQQLAFSMPSFHRLLETVSPKDLRNKNVVSDIDLEKIQNHYLQKQAQLEEAISNENRYEVNGQVYYLIKSDWLP